MAIHEENADRCDCSVIHEDVVLYVEERMPKERELHRLARLFKVLGDPTRAKILSALLHAEMCVCDIAVLLRMSKSSVSHQLRVLRQARLVKNRREGKNVFYSLDDSHIQTLFSQAWEHIVE